MPGRSHQQNGSRVAGGRGGCLGTPPPAWHPLAGLGAPGPIGLGSGPHCSLRPLQQHQKVQQKGMEGWERGEGPPAFLWIKRKKKSPEDGRKKVWINAGSPAGGETLGAVRAAMGRGLGGGLGARNAAETPTHPSVLLRGRAAMRRL